MSQLSDQEIEQGIRDAVELLGQLHSHCNADFWYRLGKAQDDAVDGGRIIGMARSYQISYLTWRPMHGPWVEVPKAGAA